MTHRILLIDGDVIAYRCAAAVEVATEWEPGYWTWHCDFEKVKETILIEIDELMQKLNAQEFRLCLTDSEENFRLKVLPSYKGNRAKVKRPLVLKPTREWLIAEHGAYLRPNLEGDDVMGILATWKKVKGEKIIVSIDKDMKTIPGLYFRDAETGLVEVSETEADYWHMYQTLVGDATDGYKGCPAIGPKAAEKILGGPTDGHQLTQLWEAVVDTYATKNLGPEEALTQARVARILRASDYDFKNRRPILWTPPTP